MFYIAVYMVFKEVIELKNTKDLFYFSEIDFINMDDSVNFF